MIDADFGNQELSLTLTRDLNVARSPGITDIQDVEADLFSVIRTVRLGEGVSLNLLSRGTRPIVAADFFRSPTAREIFDAVSREFDLVLIDTPPLLQVAYASTLVGMSDGVLTLLATGS